jgi:hypothetical protein
VKLRLHRGFALFLFALHSPLARAACLPAQLACLKSEVEEGFLRSGTAKTDVPPVEMTELLGPVTGQASLPWFSLFPFFCL